MNKIKAATASLRVLQSWGVKRVYGIPAGSFSSWMDAFAEEQDKIDFIQVKHEETGALAAAMQPKFGGSIGVALGSGGPGATHLINGLYEAREDNQPLLAILGSRPLHEQNMDAFQEMNQNPLFNDVAIYNRKVAYPEQLPQLVDEAVRRAYAEKGVAILEVPVDFGYEELDEESWWSSAKNFQKYPNPALDEEKLEEAAQILNQAKRPVIYAGVGTRGSGDDVIELSKKLKAPLVTTGKNFDNFPNEYEAFLGSAGRVATKPGVEVFEEADTVLFAGSNYPFSNTSDIFDYVDKFIQIDINNMHLGKRHDTDVAILGDAGEAIRAITEKLDKKEESAWWRANLKNNENWREYTSMLETKTQGSLQFYQGYHAINHVADEDAIYSIDVGNTTQTSIRHLHMNPKNTWRTSPLFATMGNGLPGAIAAKLDNPERQVWNIVGDGAFSMVYPDIRTAVTYETAMINVVFANQEYGFIKNKYEDTNETTYGTDFPDVDFAKIAEAQGAVGYTVTEISQLQEVFEQAVQDEKAGKVVVIDLKVKNDRPIPVEVLDLDPALTSDDSVQEYKEKYEAEDLVPFREYLENESLESQKLIRHNSRNNQ